MPYQLPTIPSHHFFFIYRKTHFKCSHVILILDSHESGGEGEEREVNLMRDWKDLEFSLD